MTLGVNFHRKKTNLRSREMTKEQLASENKQLKKQIAWLASEIVSLHINSPEYLDLPSKYFDENFWVNISEEETK